jgi:RimJ/RimL family protein N-acetyltransferase
MTPSRKWVSWEDHEKWFHSHWEHRLVAHDGPATVGIIRLSMEGVLSIIVAPNERGKGLGTQMLLSIQRVAKDIGMTKLRADVLAENVRSKGAFISAGWTPTQFEVDL